MVPSCRPAHTTVHRAQALHAPHASFRCRPVCGAHAGDTGSSVGAIIGQGRAHMGGAAGSSHQPQAKRSPRRAAKVELALSTASLTAVAASSAAAPTSVATADVSARVLRAAWVRESSDPAGQLWPRRRMFQGRLGGGRGERASEKHTLPRNRPKSLYPPTTRLQGLDLACYIERRCQPASVRREARPHQLRRARSKVARRVRDCPATAAALRVRSEGGRTRRLVRWQQGRPQQRTRSGHH